jgi:hypothetical protein
LIFKLLASINLVYKSKNPHNNEGNYLTGLLRKNQRIGKPEYDGLKEIESQRSVFHKKNENNCVYLN